MKAVALLAGLSALFSCSASWAAETAPFSLSVLLAQFANVSAASARFEETRRLAGTQTASHSRGVLHYIAPDRLERRTEFPQNERSTVNGHLLTLERTVEGKPVVRSLPLEQLPTLDAFFTALRGTLSGNQRALEDMFSVTLAGDLAAWTMTLRPQIGSMPSGVKQIRIRGESASIRRIEVDEDNGDTVRTTLTPLAPAGLPPPKAAPSPPG